MNVGTAELAGRTEGKGRSVTGIGGWGWRRGGGIAPGLGLCKRRAVH